MINKILTINKKLFKLRKVGGNALGFSLPKKFLKFLDWEYGDVLQGRIEKDYLIIELKKKNI
jgi:antitoxin component of MazEF toxin-antitoxin module